MFLLKAYITSGRITVDLYHYKVLVCTSDEIDMYSNES